MRMRPNRHVGRRVRYERESAPNVVFFDTIENGLDQLQTADEVDDKLE